MPGTGLLWEEVEWEAEREEDVGETRPEEELEEEELEILEFGTVELKKASCWPAVISGVYVSGSKIDAVNVLVVAKVIEPEGGFVTVKVNRSPDEMVAVPGIWLENAEVIGVGERVSPMRFGSALVH